MRPKCAMQASTAALTAASSVTSAATDTASPPSARMIAAVSSAASRLRSTARIFAPSRANNTAVARPLPMAEVVPGACPAPTTIAILSFSRMSPCPYQMCARAG